MGVTDLFKNVAEVGKEVLDAMKEDEEKVAQLISDTFIASIETDSNDNIVPRLEHVIQVTDDKSIRYSALEKIKISAKEKVDNGDMGKLVYDTVLYAASHSQKRLKRRIF